MQGHKIKEYINEYYIKFFEKNANVIEEDNALCNTDVMECFYVKRIGYILSIYENEYNKCNMMNRNYPLCNENYRQLYGGNNT